MQKQKKGNKNRLGKKFPHTEETKKHLSEYFKKHNPKCTFKKGCIPWNKGKTNVYSEETKKKMGEKHIGKELSKEHKDKISKKHKGKKKGPLSEQHRINLGKSLRLYNDNRRKEKEKN